MDIRCIVAGGREFHDYPLLVNKLDFFFVKKVITRTKIIIISGTAFGADQLGEAYAIEKRLECIRMPAEWDKYGKSAGYKRNEEMAKVATHLIAFWDGKSRGTKHMIDLAKKAGLVTRIVHY